MKKLKSLEGFSPDPQLSNFRALQKKTPEKIAPLFFSADAHGDSLLFS